MSKQNLNIDPNDLKSVFCSCGSRYFVNVSEVKIMSALVSPNGQEGIVPVPTLICNSCGKDIQNVLREKMEAENEKSVII